MPIDRGSADTTSADEVGREATRALARLPGRLMQGDDVAELQRQLIELGYEEVGEVDGTFGARTELGLRRFQTEYDVLNDGVLGRVSQRVLRFLRENRVTKESPPTIQQRHLISFIVKAQHSGLLLIDLVSRAKSLSASAWAELAEDAISGLGRRVEHEIERLTGMQAWLLDKTDFGHDEEQLAEFANNIDAEFLISLSLNDSASTGPGVATYYFGTGGDVYSHVGKPLALSIHQETVRVAGAIDRGVHAEHSVLFERARVPTVRVEFGNIADGRDRSLLSSGDYLTAVAKGIASGIKRFYLLGQDDDTNESSNLVNSPAATAREPDGD